MAPAAGVQSQVGHGGLHAGELVSDNQDGLHQDQQQVNSETLPQTTTGELVSNNQDGLHQDGLHQDQQQVNSETLPQTTTRTSEARRSGRLRKKNCSYSSRSKGNLRSKRVNRIEFTHPDIFGQIHPSRNPGIDPRLVTFGSNKKLFS